MTNHPCSLKLHELDSCFFFTCRFLLLGQSGWPQVQSLLFQSRHKESDLSHWQEPSERWISVFSRWSNCSHLCVEREYVPRGFISQGQEFFRKVKYIQPATSGGNNQDTAEKSLINKLVWYCDRYLWPRPRRSPTPIAVTKPRSVARSHGNTLEPYDRQ